MGHRVAMRIAHTSCQQGGISYPDVGRDLGNLKPAALFEFFSAILIRISEDAAGSVPPSILRSIDYISMYLLRACQALERFDDWNFSNQGSELPSIAFGRSRQVLSRPIVPFDYGNFHAAMSGILESLEERLLDDDRPCLRVLYIYANLVRVYAGKVSAEISASRESLELIGQSARREGGCCG
jgi:hypothetical protein